MPRRAARRKPARVTHAQSFSSKAFIAYTYQPTSKKRFSSAGVARVIRSRLTTITGNRIWIRARGGRPRYRNSWWSSPELDPAELADADDEELLDMLGGLEDPWILDIISSRKKQRRKRR